MQSVCSRKPPYKIHEDLRDSSLQTVLSMQWALGPESSISAGTDRAMAMGYGLLAAYCGTLSEIDPRPFLEISAKM